jgi:hypothetical protein
MNSKNSRFQAWWYSDGSLLLLSKLVLWKKLEIILLLFTNTRNPIILHSLEWFFISVMWSEVDDCLSISVQYEKISLIHLTSTISSYARWKLNLVLWLEDFRYISSDMLCVVNCLNCRVRSHPLGKTDITSSEVLFCDDFSLTTNTMCICSNFVFICDFFTFCSCCI